MLSTREAEWLLTTLCTSLGICLPPSVRQQLRDNPPSEVGRFTDAVFVGEGLDPTTADRTLYRQAHAMVADAFHRSEGRRKGDA